MITVLNLISRSLAVAGLTVAGLTGCAARQPAGGTDAAAPEAAPVWVERRAYAMGTVLEARVAAGDRAEGVEALEAVFAEVRRLEGILSSWSEESEIGRLNAAPAGVPAAISPELAAILREVEVWADSTGGAFDPAVGALIDAWDLRGDGRRPTAAEVGAARAASGMELYRIDRSTPAVTRLAGPAWLDSGGFGKGAALRAAGAALRRRGVQAAYLDFGGQVLAFGPSPAGDVRWEVAVADPTNRARAVSVLRLDGGSVATSAQSERSVEVDGQRFGHVLDPRTGAPVPGGVSVTVVTEDAMVADVLATALLVMGPEEGGRWAEGVQDVAVLFLVESDGAVQESWNTAFERYRVQ